MRYGKDKHHCYECGTEDTSKFMPANTYKCRECAKVKSKKYEKTHQGFLMRMYRNMESRIKGVQKAKHHLYVGKDLWTREEFYSYARENETFLKLFKEYEESGFDRKLAPSVDRIDSSKGYSVDNCEWITHSENSSRGQKSKPRKEIEEIDSSGQIIKVWSEANEAAEAYGIKATNIRRCATGAITSTNGRIFRYKTNQ